MSRSISGVGVNEIKEREQGYSCLEKWFTQNAGTLVKC